MPSSKRSFEYQNPDKNKTNVELKGTLQKKIILPEAKEENRFRKMTKADKPDTNRTLIPDLAVYT
jgi:hypothetical protein